jgi:uncharacterized membrane protein YGL010W
MRSRQEFIVEYAKSHRNFANQIIHMICVPLIYFATAGLLWAVKLDFLLPEFASTTGMPFNLAVVAFVPVLVFYARLGVKSLMDGAIWTLASLAAILAIESSGLLLAVVCGGIWIAAWVFQFVGHHIEKAKPSFGDDLVFLLIGPLFVQEKFAKMARQRSLAVLRG